jgi:hypothetical protein
MFVVSAKPSRYQQRDTKNELFVVSAVTIRHHKSIFKNNKNTVAPPGERDPLLGLLDQQAVDEVPCHGADHRRPATVGGEPQRLLDDVAERGTISAALERRGPVTTSTSQQHCRGPRRG